MTDRDRRHLRAWGARLRAEANDLKRTAEAVADETGWPVDLVRRVFDGDAARAETEALARAFCDRYPVAWRDVAVDVDDSDDGVVVVTAADSALTERVFGRPTAAGGVTAYYAYRDTAMTRGAPFRPEWIQPLRVLPDADPGDPEVAMNKGHLLHQFTFFIGNVTLYWEVDGVRHACALGTGDSCYITPFVPHSFASRDSHAPGLIIAVTYGGALKAALPELSGVHPDALDRLSGRADTALAAFGARLGRCMAAESISGDALVARAADIEATSPGELRHEPVFPGTIALAATAGSLGEVVRGERLPSLPEARILSAALNVPAAALLAEALPARDAVIVRRFAAAPCRAVGLVTDGGCLHELARSARQPQLKAFALRPARTRAVAPDFHHGLHEYVYNYGDTPVAMAWWGQRGERHEVVLDPGASAYVRPFVRHAFHLGDHNDTYTSSGASLLVVRVPGLVTHDALDEYATAGPTRARALHETDRWF
jgi:uncharacterized RmlC-like cupin family protein